MFFSLWQDGEEAPYQVKLTELPYLDALIWVGSDTDRLIRCIPSRQPRDRRIADVDDAVSEQIVACDPKRTLGASDFCHVFRDVADTVRRVMNEGVRTELDEEDRAYISRRVRAMIHPAPSASEAMMVRVVDDDDLKHEERGGERRHHAQRPEDSSTSSSRAKPQMAMRRQPLDENVVDEGGRHLQRAAMCNDVG